MADAKRARAGLLGGGLAVALVLLAVGAAGRTSGKPGPNPSASPTAAAAALRPGEVRTVTYPRQGLTFDAPVGWSDTIAPCCDVVALSGGSPPNALSISYGKPYEAQYCLPTCTFVQVLPAIPYDRSQVL